MNKRIPIPPGATIKELLEDREISQAEFACKMSMCESDVDKLLRGEMQLTSDVAERLESTLGVSARFWCNLEALYREKLKK